MKITNIQLRLLIKEALKDVKYAERGEDGYTFSSQFPSAGEELYGQAISDNIAEVEVVSDFFKESLIDVNIIVVPDQIYLGLLGHIHNIDPGFQTLLDNSFIGKLLNKLSASSRGLGKQIQQIRNELDPTSYNIIIQRRDRDRANALLFDLSWLSHDFFGHAINLAGSSPLKKLGDAFVHILTFGKLSLDKFYQGAGFEKELRIADRSELGKSMIDPAIVKSIQADFEKENFTPGVGASDLGASLIGYYTVKGKFPPTVYDMITAGKIDGKKINKMEDELIKKLEQLKGKTGFVNFGDQVN